MERSRLHFRSARQDQGVGRRGTSHGIVRRLDCATAPLDTTGGRREEPRPKDKAYPHEPTSSRPKGPAGPGVERPPRREAGLSRRAGDAERSHGLGVTDRSRRARGDVSASLRSARHDQGAGGGGMPSEPRVMSTGGSTVESRSGDISTDLASPNGSSIPERLRHARGGVSTALPLRSTRPEAGRGDRPYRTEHAPQNTTPLTDQRVALAPLARIREGRKK